MLRLYPIIPLLVACRLIRVEPFSVRKNHYTLRHAAATGRAIVTTTATTTSLRLSATDNDTDDSTGGADGDFTDIPIVGGMDSFKPPAAPANPLPPNKSDVYSEDELMSLLQVHNDLSSQTLKPKRNDDMSARDGPDARIGFPSNDINDSLHDMVLQTLAQIDSNEPTAAAADSDNDGNEQSSSNSNGASDSIATPSTKYDESKLKDIHVVISDIDGTLIGSDQTIHPRTLRAVNSAIASASSPNGKLDFFLPATGKTRAGAFASLGPELANALQEFPGVFIQGLYCVLGDEVIFERRLSQDAVRGAERLVEEFDCSIVAYDGDQLYTSRLTDIVVELHERYGEPLAQQLDVVADHPAIHKVLLMDHDLEKLARLRPKLEELGLTTQASVTQAVPTMLELIPEGCSKAFGVQKMCEALGVTPSVEVMAIGDAENDVGMIEMAAVGVAVGNGNDMIKDVADIVLEETNDEGGAGAAIELLGDLN